MTYDNFVKAQLLAYALREGARHGGFDNTLAVAHVIAARVRAGWEGGDWLRVISTAAMHSGTVYEDTPPVNPRDIAFRTVLQRIDDIFSGVADAAMIRAVINAEGKERTALYYCEMHNVNRPWFSSEILSDLEAHPRLANVGPVTFFG